MTNAFDDVNMKPLGDRQMAVQNKIAALPGGIGTKLVELLASTREQEELKMLILMGMMGPELWDEYWAVHRDTTEHNAKVFFDKMAQAGRDKKNIFSGD
jgi:hypothetical protein